VYFAEIINCKII